MKREKKITVCLSAVYLIILTWVILFKMALSVEMLPSLRSINLIPYGESAMANGKIDLQELIYNAVAFVPVGVYLAMLKPQWSFVRKVLPIAGLSLIYEVLQYIFAIGASDITDLINNTIGGIIGICVYALFAAVLKDRADKVLNILAIVGTVMLAGLMGLLIVVNL